MIYDSLKHLKNYPFLEEKYLAKITSFLEKQTGATPAGRYDFEDGSGIFALFSDLKLRNLSTPDLFIESHHQYIDLQYLICGKKEVMGHKPIEHLIAGVYDPDKDFQKWKEPRSLESDLNFITVHPQEFVVFFPHDAHLPGLILGEDSKNDEVFVKKVVLKIPRTNGSNH